MLSKVMQFSLAVGLLLMLATPVFAQAADGKSTNVIAGAGAGAGLGAALTLIGAGIGFGKIGAAALDSMARQPEVAPRVMPTMIVIAALLEGAVFFALFICYSIATSNNLGAM
jgi:F-type H+-transporting ATPase subunit c